MNEQGIEYQVFYSRSKQQIFCKIRMDLRTLEKHADYFNYKMLLDETALARAAGRGIRWSQLDDIISNSNSGGAGGAKGDVEEGERIKIGEYKVHPIVIPHEARVSPLGPFQYIYAEYETGEIRSDD